MRWNDIAVSVVGCLLASTYVIANPMNMPPQRRGSIQLSQYRSGPMPSLPSSVNAATATASQAALLDRWQGLLVNQPRISKIKPVKAHREELLIAYANYDGGNEEVPAFVKCSMRTENADNEDAIFAAINDRLQIRPPLIRSNELHFVRRLHIFKPNGYTCIVMTRAGTDNLYTYIHKVKKSKAFPEIMKSIAEQLFTGVFYLHTLRIAHRDLNPSNVMIATSKEDFSDPKLNIIDFDLAIDFLLPGGKISSGTQVLPHVSDLVDLFTGIPGTTGFIPPELCTVLDAKAQRQMVSLTKADVWSAAMTLLVPLSDTPPFCYDFIKRDMLSAPACISEMKDIYQDYKDRGNPFGVLNGASKMLMGTWVPVLQDMLVVNPRARVPMTPALLEAVKKRERLPRPAAQATVGTGTSTKACCIVL